MATWGVLAHQGGWDEALFVLVPVSIFAGLLSLANKRAARRPPEGDPGGRHDIPAAPGTDEP